MKYIKNLYLLLRVKHYIKNILIFVPLIFSGELFNEKYFYSAIWGFILFSLITSVVYIINDINDYEYDKINEAKKNRPIANGSISKTNALIIAMILLSLFFLFAYMLYTWGGVFLRAIFIPLLYLLLNIGYSFGLKNIPIIDVAIIAIGFILRALYGGIIINVEISNWVYLTVITGSLYLGLGKRKKELYNFKGITTRKVLSGYTVNFLDKNMYMCMSLCLMFYSLACIDLKTKAAQMGGRLIWTVPLVLLISLKYNLNLESKKEGDPTNIILDDKGLILLILLYGASIIYTIY